MPHPPTSPPKQGGAVGLDPMAGAGAVSRSVDDDQWARRGKFWRLFRAIKLLLGMSLSGFGVLGGLWLLENRSPVLAVGPISAGLWVLMRWVADDLVPGASKQATGMMKLTMVLALYGWASLVGWSFLLGKQL